MSKEQQHIGFLIKELRKQRGLTQSEFASLLNTSQSAVARMENGGQNFSTQELSKISKALGHPLVSISDNSTDDLEIHGGKKLSGEITTNTSKNGAMGLVCAALLNKGVTILHGIPRIQEINRMFEVFESISVKVKWIDDNSVEITPPEHFDLGGLHLESARRMRSIIMTIAPFAHHLDEFALPHASGCKMGKRTIAAHQHGLDALGIKIKVTDDEYQIFAKRLKGTEITMYEASDTATENILMAAALIPGKTTIHFAQQNYMVQDVIGFLRKAGVTITQTDVSTLTVEGVQEINETIEYHNSEDPIETMALLTAGIMTDSEIMVRRCPIDFLRLEVLKLKLMGQKFSFSDEYTSHNGFTKLVDITVHPSKLKALTDKIHPLPYPGINVDNLPFFVPIATKAKGTTLVHDWMWENRAIYFTELNRLNAQVRLADPHRLYIEGPTDLRAGQIVCPPALRPSMIIMLAMLAAPGVSILRNVYSIKRGYEDIVNRLNALGADIRFVKDITA